MIVVCWNYASSVAQLRDVSFANYASRSAL